MKKYFTNIKNSLFSFSFIELILFSLLKSYIPLNEHINTGYYLVDLIITLIIFKIILISLQLLFQFFRNLFIKNENNNNKKVKKIKFKNIMIFIEDPYYINKNLIGIPNNLILE
jgi:hypothetical protein